LPANKTAAPVVLFSHGLGGNREGSAFLGKHWAMRGYVAVFLQHPGSDDSVWKDLPVAQRMAALKQAAGLKEFLWRVQDVSAVLDQLDVWNKDSAHSLAGRLDLKHVGMSGHSFGAVTTRAVSGQVPPLGKGFTDDFLKIPHTWTVLPGVEHNPMKTLEALGDSNWAFFCEAFEGLK